MSDDVSHRLIEAGLSPAAAQTKTELFNLSVQKLLPMSRNRRDTHRYYVPGRIEVLGKHTDYAGGRSLLCAAERGICVAASGRDDTTLRIYDVVSHREAELSLSSDSNPDSHWLRYVSAVARRIRRNFPGELRGVDISFGSDLPRASGMSSSSALVIAMFSALAGVNQLSEREEYKVNIRTPEDLATYLACIENGQSFGAFSGDAGVGTHGGSEDHIAILCCAPARLSQYSFCPAQRERDITLSEDLAFVIGVSGIAADKTGDAKDAYNRAALAAATILEIWRDASHSGDKTLFAAVTSSHDAPERIRDAIRKSNRTEFPSLLLLNRLDQFILETIEIIPAAAEAWTQHDWRTFGRIVDRSQSAAETLLNNQIPETIGLARSARQLGAIAASAFGAGFGGSVWALVAKDEAQRFTTAWADAYRRQFPEAAVASQFFATRPGPAMFAL